MKMLILYMCLNRGRQHLILNSFTYRRWKVAREIMDGRGLSAVFTV